MFLKGDSLGALAIGFLFSPEFGVEIAVAELDALVSGFDLVGVGMVMAVCRGGGIVVGEGAGGPEGGGVLGG